MPSTVSLMTAGAKKAPAYWAYGFGHYLFTAHALFLKTDGELNIMQGEKIERICRYPLAAHIEGSFRSTFADSSHGYIPYRHARIINEFYDIPELYELCATHPDRSLKITSSRSTTTERPPANRTTKIISCRTSAK